MIAHFGLVLLVMVGVGIIATGLPVAFVLIGLSIIGAAAGVISSTIPLALLSTLPGRLVNLLENDLLQALPLYVFTGFLLDRLPLADALYRTSVAVLPKTPAGPLVSGMGLGALLGPMNGSVGASVLALSRVVYPRLADAGVPAATRFATVAVASTLGVVIPPSLVLILLGDAMLSAHTMAVTQTGRADRVVNTQDIFHGALAPAGLLLVLCLALAWAMGRRLPGKEVLRGRVTAREAVLATTALIAVVALLGGVAAGYFYAVEAAAMAAFVLLIAGLATGRLRGAAMRDLLTDVMATTGALFGLLIAATTFTLMLRLLGTDRLVTEWIVALPGSKMVVTLTILAVIGLCAFVLDAFEIIFVVVPIVVPPLLVRVEDARWVAVLVLLTLQTSFLLPPFGYSLMMLRGRVGDRVPAHAMLAALAPFLLAQWAVLATVLVFPNMVHLGQTEADTSRAPEAPVSTEELERRLKDMIMPLPPPE